MCSEANCDAESVHPDLVEVHENMGEWFVIVVRDGRDHVTSFELESSAKAYAEGQRLGLGVKKPAGSRQ